MAPADPAAPHPYKNTWEYLWRAVFTAAYTTLIVRKGFGIEIPDTQEAPTNALRDAVVVAADLVPPPEENAVAGPVLQGVLNALSSADAARANRKPYSAVHPDEKPWALGAAVLLACATSVELPGGAASGSAFQNLIGVDAQLVDAPDI